MLRKRHSMLLNGRPCVRLVGLGLSACGRGEKVTGPLPLTFATVSAGFEHTCGVTTGGAAYCWGQNDYGELGDATNTGPEICSFSQAAPEPCSTTPVAVAGGLPFVAVSASEHTCGVTAPDRAANCWGYNSVGQLGDGTTTDQSRPVVVTGGLTFAQVSAGSLHTCGVTVGSAAYCWGENSFGGLGDGTTTHRSSPVLVTGGLSFVQVSAGGLHTCGVTTGGAAYCWGGNFGGQLGDRDTIHRSSPVLVTGGLTFAQVSAGGSHTCSVTKGGAAYCWGAAQLGDGTNGGPEICMNNTPCSTTPIAVAGGLTFVTVSAGSRYACGVTTVGAAYCWGENLFGQLGVGDTTDRSSPVPVSGGLTFAAVSAGTQHTCGVTTGGAVYCWGFNAYGQLGNGPNRGPEICLHNRPCSTAPVAVGAGSPSRP